MSKCLRQNGLWRQRHNWNAEGFCAYCGCKRQSWGRQKGYKAKNRPKMPLRPQCRKPAGMVALNQLFNSYRHNAKRRGYVFGLTKDEFSVIVAKPCSYCDSPPLSVRRQDYDAILYSGIDRIDNALGYVPGNCAPCCKRCNMMKGTMTTQQFFDAIRVIHAKRLSVSEEVSGESTLNHTVPLIQ
jgi:hypothetical protein